MRRRYSGALENVQSRSRFLHETLDDNTRHPMRD